MRVFSNVGGEINFKIDTFSRCSASVLRIVFTSLSSAVRFLHTSKIKQRNFIPTSVKFHIQTFNLHEFV